MCVYLRRRSVIVPARVPELLKQWREEAGGTAYLYQESCATANYRLVNSPRGGIGTVVLLDDFFSPGLRASAGRLG